MTSSSTYYVSKCGSTRLCDQNCGVQPADRQTDTQTHTGTDKSLKTEGPKILSNDIFYFRTVIIGGPMSNRLAIIKPSSKVKACGPKCERMYRTGLIM